MGDQVGGEVGSIVKDEPVDMPSKTIARRSARRGAVALFTTVDLSSLNGPSLHFLNIANGLGKLGYDITVMAPRIRGPTVLAFGPSLRVVFTVPTRQYSLPGAVASLLMLPALWRARRADAIYVRSSSGTLVLAMAARLFGTKTIIVECNGWLGDELQIMGVPSAGVRLVRWMQLREALLADRVRVVTDSLRAKFVACGVPQDRLTVIPTGTNTDNFRPLDRQDARRILSLDPGGRYLIFIGNLWPAIDLGTVFEAMSILRARGQDLHLLVVGDGASRADLEAQARRCLGSNPSVTFLGSRAPQDANVALCAADVAVAPFARSRNESTGLSPLKIRDYAAAGAIIVSSAVAGIRELGGEPWLVLVEPEDPALFATGIEAALAIDGVAAGRRARDYALANFDWSHVVFEVANLIDAARAEAGSASAGR
jgi:glycosyltransferase involved in cell wall biosynthesis